jgi:hypothetical protein
MKMSLLEMTQNILSALDGDEVNSIGDTVESLQVAEIIKETFFEIFGNEDQPSHSKAILLDSLADPSKPNYLRLPDEVREVKWIKYDYQREGRTSYEEVKYLNPEQFVLRTLNRASQDNIVEVVDFSGAKFNIKTDENPQFWTTFDNVHVIFDSYNRDLDSVVQQSKSLCWGEVVPSFLMSDTFVPDIPASDFPLLLSEAKSTAFLYQKQMASQKDEQRSRRQRVRRQNNKWRMNQREPYNQTPDYGRRIRG